MVQPHSSTTGMVLLAPEVSVKEKVEPLVGRHLPCVVGRYQMQCPTREYLEWQGLKLAGVGVE